MTQIQKFLSSHHRGCTVHLFSGGRHCSCGRDAAILEFEKIIGWLKELTDYDVGGTYRYPDIQELLKKIDSESPPQT